MKDDTNSRVSSLSHSPHSAACVSMVAAGNLWEQSGHETRDPADSSVQLEACRSISDLKWRVLLSVHIIIIKMSPRVNIITDGALHSVLCPVRLAPASSAPRHPRHVNSASRAKTVGGAAPPAPPGPAAHHEVIKHVPPEAGGG